MQCCLTFDISNELSSRHLLTIVRTENWSIQGLLWNHLLSNILFKLNFLVLSSLYQYSTFFHISKFWHTQYNVAGQVLTKPKDFENNYQEGGTYLPQSTKSKCGQIHRDQIGATLVKCQKEVHYKADCSLKDWVDGRVVIEVWRFWQTKKSLMLSW